MYTKIAVCKLTWAIIYAISYRDTLLLEKRPSRRLCTTTVNRRPILFAGFFGAHEGHEERTLPTCLKFRELTGGGRGLRGGTGKRRKSGWGVSWMTSELSISTPTSGRLQPRTRGDGARRWNNGRNVSWRNGSL